MVSSLRVAIVGPLAPPAGGMAAQTKQLCARLIAEGIDAEVVRTNPPWRPRFVAGVRGVRALFRFIPYLWRLWCASGRCNVVHVMANSGWAWHLSAAPAVCIGKLRRRRVVVNYRGGLAEPFLERSAAWIRPTMRMADAIVVPSGFLRAVFARFGIETMIVPNVVDTALFSPGGSAPGERAKESPHVVMTRNLEPIYDVATGLRAFAKLRESKPAARLSVAGDGPERAALETLAREFGVANSVVFRGSLSRDEIAALYRSATLMLNSSVADNTPNALIEAMACGIPIVSTDAGGIRFLVRDRETALLCPTRDVDALARAMLEVLDDLSLAAGLAANGREAVRGCTWDAVFPLWMRVYRPDGSATAAVAEAVGIGAGHRP